MAAGSIVDRCWKKSYIHLVRINKNPYFKSPLCTAKWYVLANYVFFRFFGLWDLVRLNYNAVVNLCLTYVYSRRWHTRFFWVISPTNIWTKIVFFRCMLHTTFSINWLWKEVFFFSSIFNSFRSKWRIDLYYSKVGQPSRYCCHNKCDARHLQVVFVVYFSVC